VAAAALLARSSDPTADEVRHAMSGNLCRCGTYPKIVRAIQAAATAMRAGVATPAPSATVDASA
jgi:aerobic-type carbon monoxide dehydrogenase small subunit (CoxS/CutS family)